MRMRDNHLFHGHVPQCRSSHVHCFLVIVDLALVVRADVGEARNAVDAGRALEELDCFLPIGGLCGESFGGETFSGGDEIGCEFVGIGVVYVVLGLC